MNSSNPDKVIILKDVKAEDIKAAVSPGGREGIGRHRARYFGEAFWNNSRYNDYYFARGMRSHPTERYTSVGFSADSH
jgi:hypothetical protein